MNGFQCRITNATSTVGLATSKLARRCGADPANGKPNAVPGNCTYGAKQPLYWLQAEQNNVSILSSFVSMPPLTIALRCRCLKEHTPLLFTTISTTSRTARRTTFSKIRTRVFQSLGPIKLLFLSLLFLEPFHPQLLPMSAQRRQHSLPRLPRSTRHCHLLCRQLRRLRNGWYLFLSYRNASDFDSFFSI